MAEDRSCEQGWGHNDHCDERTTTMPELTSALRQLDSQANSDLVIDAFDQWHNSADGMLGASLQTFTGLVPADVTDPA
ncbi:MAG TPA: hypothetical protein VLM05_16760 [Mycobacteriales bacterium]|nr:hypothetical protein [Mycobacteriales bacterium]